MATSYSFTEFVYSPDSTSVWRTNVAGERYTDATDATATLTFTVAEADSTITIISRSPASNRGIVAFSVDGGAETLVDLYAPSPTAAEAPSADVWTSGPLAVGQHTVRFRATGTKNAAISGITEWYSVSGARLDAAAVGGGGGDGSAGTGSVLASSTFDTDLDGWRSDAESGSTVTAGSGSLLLRTGSASAYAGGAIAYWSGQTDVADAETRFVQTVPGNNDVRIYVAVQSTGSKANQRLPYNGYVMDQRPGGNSVTLSRMNGGTETEMQGGSFTWPAAGTPWVTAIRREGVRTRVALWALSVEKPVDWAVDTWQIDVTDPTPYTTAGKAHILVSNGASSNQRESRLLEANVYSLSGGGGGTGGDTTTAPTVSIAGGTRTLAAYEEVTLTATSNRGFVTWSQDGPPFEVLSSNELTITLRAPALYAGGATTIRATATNTAGATATASITANTLPHSEFADADNTKPVFVSPTAAFPVPVVVEPEEPPTEPEEPTDPPIEPPVVAGEVNGVSHTNHPQNLDERQYLSFRSGHDVITAGTITALTFPNVYGTNPTPPNAITLRASVEVNGTRYRLVDASNSIDMVIQPKTYVRAVIQGGTSVPVTAGQRVYVHGRVNTGSTTGKYPVSNWKSATFGERQQATSSDLTMSGLPDDSLYDQMYAPVAIDIDPTVAPAANVAVWGDSIAYGSNRSDGRGFLDMPLTTAGIPHSKFALIGEQGNGITGSTPRKLLFTADTFTHVVWAYGINDFNSGANLATVQSRVLAGRSQAADLGAAFVVTTVTPKATGDVNNPDGMTPNLPAGQEPHRLAYNAWLRDGAPLSSSGAVVATGTMTSGTKRAPVWDANGLKSPGANAHPFAAVVDTAAAVTVTNVNGDQVWKAGIATTGDSFHPNGSGHSLMGAVWAKYVEGGLVASDPFVLETTQPTADNTGPRYAIAQTISGDFTPASNTTYDRVKFTGRILTNSSMSGVVFRDCHFAGSGARSSDSALVNNELASSTIRYERCLFKPDTPSQYWHGIRGKNYTLDRCRFENVVDGWNVNVGGTVNVKVHGCYVDSLSYFSPCSYQTDNRTHNDGAFIFGGSGIEFLGNRIAARASEFIGDSTNPSAPAPNPYHPSVTGQALGCSPSASVASPPADVTVRGNWFSHGAQSITIVAGSGGIGSGWSITGNRFDTRTNPVIGGARRAVYVASGLSIPGLPAATGSDTQGNVDWDGSPVTIYRSLSDSALYSRSFSVVNSTTTTGWDLAVRTVDESITVQSDHVRCEAGGFSAGSHFARVLRNLPARDNYFVDCATPAGRFTIRGKFFLPADYYTQSEGFCRWFNTDNFPSVMSGNGQTVGAADADEWRVGFGPVSSTTKFPVLMSYHENNQDMNLWQGTEQLPAGQMHDVVVDFTPNTAGQTDGAWTLTINGTQVAQASGIQTIPESVAASERKVTTLFGGIDGAYTQNTKRLRVDLYELQIESAD